MTLNPLEIAARHRTCFHTPPKHVPAGGDDVSGNGRWRIWEYAGTKIDAPILGNGDMLSAFAGPCEYPQFWITAGFSTVESSANACKPQKCGIFLSNFVYFYVACVVCLWYNGLEVMMLETIF